MRNTSRTLAAAVVALLAAGCTSSTEPFLDPAALAAAVTFDRIADSLSATTVDPGVRNAYREVARVARSGTALSSVVISVDGVPTEFLAMAQSLDQSLCPRQSFCDLVARPPLNSVVAWQRSDPRRILQLTSDNELPIGGAMPGYTGPDPFRGRSTLTYLDGAGGVYLGTSGAQFIGASTTEQQCRLPSPPVGPELDYTPPDTRCYVTAFDVSFEGTVQPPLFALRNNTASGTHSIAMAFQPVAGTKLIALDCGACDMSSPILTPPVGIVARSAFLEPTLTATATGRDVTLTFTVRNVSTAPMRIDFRSGQQYDFIVRDSRDAALTWQWSAGKSFTQTADSRILVSGESAVFAEHWQATAPGSYSVQALLTSVTRQTTAYAPLTVQ
jgi:hypothetical protein